MHWPALQHPVGQLVASHTHTPGGAQRRPAAHGLPVPHLHAPDVQRSAAAPHAMHAAPFGPHCAAVRAVTQTLPWQQPFVHVVASQTHWPATHAWPGPHAGPAPQLQLPASHAFADGALQAAQLAPARPHAAIAVPAWHTPLRQHPVAQLVALQPAHAWPAHACPAGHVWHAEPPVPHAPAAVPVWQASFAQQPVGQLCALHTQRPPEHAWPGAHAGPEPHWHAPPLHESARVASQMAQPPPLVPHIAADGVTHWSFEQHPFGQLCASQVHAPETQRWPLAQAGPAPQPHTPAVQVSVVIVTHERQTSPPVPQRAVSETWQAPLKQQPLGQLCTSQPVQVPPSHAPPAGHSWQARPPEPQRAASTPISQKSPLQQPPQLDGPHVEAEPPPAPPASAPPPACEPPAVEPPPPALAPPPAPSATQVSATHTRPAGQG